MDSEYRHQGGTGWGVHDPLSFSWISALDSVVFPGWRVSLNKHLFSVKSPLLAITVSFMVVAAQQALGKNRAPSITSRTTKRPWLRESLGTMEWIAESTGSAEKPLASTDWEVSPDICCDNLPASFWIHKPLDFLCQICLVIFCLYIIHCTYYNTLLLFSSGIFPKGLANLDVVSPFGGYLTRCHSQKDSWFCGASNWPGGGLFRSCFSETGLCPLSGAPSDPGAGLQLHWFRDINLRAISLLIKMLSSGL